MKILFAIPHYCVRGDSTSGKHGSQIRGPVARGETLARTITSLHQLFGSSQAMIQVGARRTIPANQPACHQIRVVVVTCGDAHALPESGLPANLYQHFSVDVPPTDLGFRCHGVLAEQHQDFDYCCYLEDDLIIGDPWWFEKLQWFNQHLGQQNLLMANRYEVSTNLAYMKCYIDGDLAPHVTQGFQDIKKVPQLRSEVLGRSIRFVRPLNPHSGCFFLNSEQMPIWMAQPNFGLPNRDFVGPLETAATGRIMQTFRLYKPAPENANFFEIQHDGCQFIRKIRKP